MRVRLFSPPPGAAPLAFAASAAPHRAAGLHPVRVACVGVFVVWLVLCIANRAHADGLTELARFIQSTGSATAGFVQTVYQPVRAGQPTRQRVSHGEFAFLRPNRFRFVYSRPSRQVIVGDGQTLWRYDVDLQQVSATAQAAAMRGSPAALFATAASIAQLQSDFDLRAAPATDGLEWVWATPRTRKNRDAMDDTALIASIRIGLRPTEKAVEIAALEIVDGFGQRSVMHFSRVQLNAGVHAADFSFTPPAGMPVLRQ